MEKITLLNELNTIGEKLGYPFYLFEDGSYGKSIVNGKMNAIAVIKKPFKQTELHEVQRIVFSAPTSSQSNARKTVDGIQQTYEERVAELSDADRKKLQKAILLVRGNGYCWIEESELLLRYAQQDDVQRCLQTRSILSHGEVCGLFENSLLSTNFLKKCIEAREKRIGEDLSVQLKNVSAPESYVAYHYIQSLRPSMLLWFINKFYSEYDTTWREYSFVKRCVQLNEFSILTEYIRMHNSFNDDDALEYIVDEALNNPELYKWYTDVYLKRAQKSA